MIDRRELRRLGRLTKPHGVAGEMALLLDATVSFCEDPEYLVCLMDGIPVPFFINSIREKGVDVLLVKFQDTNSVEDTRRFMGVTTFAPIESIDQESQDEFAWSMFIGYKVNDIKAGYLGTVTAVDDSTANVLFLVKNGSRERVIPANDVWMESIDRENEIMNYNLPEGLAEL